jgi:hypothetical protein
MSCFSSKNCINVYESKKIKTNENKYSKCNKSIDKYSYIFYKTTKDKSANVCQIGPVYKRI